MNETTTAAVAVSRETVSEYHIGHTIRVKPFLTQLFGKA